MAEIDELREKVAQLQAELTVVTFERDQLVNERNAVRVYFGGTDVGNVVEQQADPANLTGRTRSLEEVADRIYAQYPDRKIQAIKELRTVMSEPHGVISFGLREAKDAIDSAEWRHRKRMGMGVATDMYGTYVNRTGP
jgi:ribosomal protein L7/L12